MGDHAIDLFARMIAIEQAIAKLFFGSVLDARGAAARQCRQTVAFLQLSGSAVRDPRSDFRLKAEATEARTIRQTA